VALATRGTIQGYANGHYGPDDGVQRAQMAALIARAMPAGPGTPPMIVQPPACVAEGSWDCEDWGNSFTDQGGIVAALWRNAGALQHYQVAFGYSVQDCAARGRAFPCYGPTDPVVSGDVQVHRWSVAWRFRSAPLSPPPPWSARSPTARACATRAP
jgi:hypothetical protein